MTTTEALIVFLDPPYATESLAPTLATLSQNEYLPFQKKKIFLIYESDRKTTHPRLEPLDEAPYKFLGEKVIARAHFRFFQLGAS